MAKRETIELDDRAQQRLLILNHILAGDLTAAEAAQSLDVSVRSVRRLLARYRSPEGAAALVHGNRGRTPSNRVSAERRAQLIELAGGDYRGVNRAHLADLLAEREQITIPARTLRRILAEAGVPAVKQRRARGHRSRRQRMSQAGLLVQVDGSRHDWLEGRGPYLTLVGAIDDATGLITGAVFREQEDSAGYLAVLAQTAAAYGLPVGVYSDRHTIFWSGRGRPLTIAEQFSGQRRRTQVGRALEAAAIAWIAARSPQAKGRVERLWGTAQDRLRSELRLAAATTLAEANAVLADYVPRHNARFGVAASDEQPAWRPLPAGWLAESIFCFRHPRRMAADGTFSVAGRELMLAGWPIAAWRGRSVEVQERLDGSLWAAVGDRFVAAVPAPPRPVVVRAAAAQHGAAERKRYIPPRDHPWRRYPASSPRCQSR